MLQKKKIHRALRLWEGGSGSALTTLEGHEEVVIGAQVLSDGRLLLTFGRRFAPYGLYARLSDDAGRTWGPTSWLLRSAPDRNQGYSSSLELKPGRIFTACYARNKNGVTGITGTFWKTPPM